MMTTEQLNRLENFGFTNQGAAIVDAIWFTPSPSEQIGMVLICNPCGTWKAYIGVIQISPQSIFYAQVPRNEAWDAKHIAHSGYKLPYAIAKAAFANRPFDNLNYDLGEVQVRDV